jgi:choline-sulfatase
MVQNDHYKLILYPEAKKVQLFDTANDPWEMTNLATDPRQSETISGLFRDLKKWQETVNDPLILDPSIFGIQA